MIRSGNEGVLSNWNEFIRIVHTQIKNIKSWIEGNYYKIQSSSIDSTLTLQKIARDLRLIDLLVDIV